MASAIISSFESNEIIPDVLTYNSLKPIIFLSVVYPNGTDVSLGNEIVRDDTLEEPAIILAPIGLQAIRKDATYTLVMTDPDAPSRAEPKFRQWRHWIITGLTVPPSNETGNLVALKTKASITPYIPPTPHAGSGVHRYCFLLYEEPSPDFAVPTDATEHKVAFVERRGWNAVNFAETYGLELVGANYFLMRAADA